MNKELLRDALDALIKPTSAKVGVVCNRLRAAIDAPEQGAHSFYQGDKLLFTLDASNRVVMDQPVRQEPVADLTDDEIIKIAIDSRGAEPGRDGYILPITFARAVLSAQRGKG